MDMPIFNKFYWSWIHLIEQTCPSWPVPVKKKPTLNYRILPISYCLYLVGGGGEGERILYLCRTPYLPDKPLKLLNNITYFTRWLEIVSRG